MKRPPAHFTCHVGDRRRAGVSPQGFLPTVVSYAFSTLCFPRAGALLDREEQGSGEKN